MLDKVKRQLWIYISNRSVIIMWNILVHKYEYILIYCPSTQGHFWPLKVNADHWDDHSHLWCQPGEWRLTSLYGPLFLFTQSYSDVNQGLQCAWQENHGHREVFAWSGRNSTCVLYKLWRVGGVPTHVWWQVYGSFIIK